MIVWRDTLSRTMACPSWLPDDRVARVHTDRGDLLCMDRYHALLGWREDAAWVSAGDGWEAALYAPFDPADYLRPVKWTLFAAVTDAKGRNWLIPAILWPSDHKTLPGPPIVAQARRLTTTGWIREAVDARQQAALDAAVAAFPHLSDLGAVDLETSSNWLSAIIECTHLGGPLTFAALGLYDDVLAQHALRVASGWLDRARYSEMRS